MIALSNSTAQTLAVGESITFDTTNVNTGRCACHRANSSLVKMCGNGYYEVTFNGNISSPTAGTAVQLAIEAGGEALSETTMISTPATADVFNSVSASTIVNNCCCDYSRLTVTNNGGSTLTVDANSSFIVRGLN